MRYVVDRIIDNIAVLENIDNKEKKEVEIDLLPKQIKDGTILLLDNNNYIIDSVYETNRREILRNKLNRLVGKNND